jgi:hypothetical protein
MSENVSDVWKMVKIKFSNSPAQLQVARVLLRYGLGVADNSVYCGGMRVSDAQIAKEAGVDRRVVRSTVKTISKDKEAKKIFEALRPVVFLKDVATTLGLGVIEIIPQDASKPGIISDVTGIISDAGISIRQAITDDPYISENARMTIITDSKISGDLIEKLRSIKYVESVVVYK